jgi:hypothetical protein
MTAMERNALRPVVAALGHSRSAEIDRSKRWAGKQSASDLAVCLRGFRQRRSETRRCSRRPSVRSVPPRDIDVEVLPWF